MQLGLSRTADLRVCKLCKAAQGFAGYVEGIEHGRRDSGFAQRSTDDFNRGICLLGTSVNKAHDAAS
ncbi:hypothetical protein WI79_30170 [Burkholderia ubonensis]|nr:hypothetical protein WI79_30170 [Burkholderia ubonensis]